MYRPSPRPSPVRRSRVPEGRVRKVRGHEQVRKDQGALQEPPVPPTFQSAGRRLESRRYRFMVPGHGSKAKGALEEPAAGRAGCPQPAAAGAPGTAARARSKVVRRPGSGLNDCNRGFHGA